MEAGAAGQEAENVCPGGGAGSWGLGIWFLEPCPPPPPRPRLGGEGWGARPCEAHSLCPASSQEF